jgi:hypothetical protein
MSDTPETDHIESNLGNSAHPILLCFCRKLEREHNEAREQRNRLMEALRDTANGTSCQECGGEDQARFAREAIQSITSQPK